MLARMQHRQLAGAFDCFAGAVETIVAQRDQIAKSVVKWRAPGVKRAVDRWLEYMDMMAQERVEEARDSVERLLAIMERVTELGAHAAPALIDVVGHATGGATAPPAPGTPS